MTDSPQEKEGEKEEDEKEERARTRALLGNINPMNLAPGNMTKAKSSITGLMVDTTIVMKPTDMEIDERKKEEK